ncbi:MAG: DUF362 domain-containing protein [Candidatus Aminicenantes bacterium]|nr:DUF362 domain-containing protein [Candidatus Aminicenantes bacterium]
MALTELEVVLAWSKLLRRSKMTTKLSRREFIKSGTALGAAAVAAGSGFTWTAGATRMVAAEREVIDISAVGGSDYFDNTNKAVDMLGGMGQFVSKDSRVAVLINSAFRNPGTIVNPDIALAIIRLCFEAGAKEVCSLLNEKEAYWSKSLLAEEHSEILAGLTRTDGTTKIEIPQGKSLREVQVLKDFLEYDVLIDIPIVKDHTGTNFTGTLKNYMGVSGASNRYFHTGSNPKSKGYYEEIPFLSQCIADLNLLRKPDLCVVDATEFVTSNGPFGPGKLKKLDKVVAGVDRVAMDSYVAGFLGYKGEDILMIKMAHEHGLGEINIGKLKISEV